MRERNLTRTLLVASVLTAVGSVAFAAEADPPPLPPEAYTACASKSEGDACTVTMHDKTIDGTCATHPNETKLHCRPSGPPPGPPPSK
jgi:hypothetical protein